MDFALLAPEVNSGRMYAGPGSGPMLAAAAAWQGLAAELYSAASSSRSAIAGLTAGPWLGPSSASMAAAAATYAAWLSTTAAQAEQTATQAKAAAACYEAAFAATVPPPVIATNRSLLTALVATNVFGQNTPAIAATETDYAEMWAQDAAAMYGYAGASAPATTLTPFTPPPRTTNPGGLAGAAAVGRGFGTAAAFNTHTVLSRLTSAVPTTLQGLASPLQMAPEAGASTSGLTGILQSLDLLSLPALTGTGVSSADLSATSGAWQAAAAADTAIMTSQADLDSDGHLLSSTLGEVKDLGAQIMTRFDQLGAVRPAVSASLGQSAPVGALSVPPAWTAAAPAIRLATVALPATSLSAAAEGFTAGPGGLFGEMALASVAGRAIGGTAGLGRWERGGATTSAHAVLPQRSQDGPVTRIAVALHELAELRDSGLLTDEEFNEQKRRVLA